MASNDSAAAWYLGATTPVTLPWLIRVRWTSALIQTGVVVIAFAAPQLDLPLRRIAPLLVATILMNGSTWLTQKPSVPRAAAAGDLFLQGLLLTGLIELTGGPFNPFIVIYAVQIALAWLTLGASWGTLLSGWAATCFGVLVYWHTMELIPGHHRLNDFPTHLFTMWTAAAVTAELAAYFVSQASNALARHERAFDAMRDRAARTERLVSLTTLAAGAAHELSTPLATIALSAKELEHAAISRGDVPDLADDARLIRAQVDRCQAILDQMSGRAGGIAADAPEPLDISSLIGEIRERLTTEQGQRLVVRVPAALPPARFPRAAFSQALLSLLNNAFDATSGSATPVIVEVMQDAVRLRVSVTDSGHGMPVDVLQRAGEPFYTTKEPGRGMGLGLFLARVFAERFGGTLSLHSDTGTTAVLELPLESAGAR